MALELRELSIPGDPERTGDESERVSLHIQIAREGTDLTVSVWDRGEFVGLRRVSDTNHSTILARRVGLAVGELASRLAQKRLRTKQLLEREAAFQAKQLEVQAEIRQHRALTLRSGLTSVVVPQGAWSLGPTLGLAFNQNYPLSFSGDVSWTTGSIPALSDATLGGTAPSWSQLEFLLGADYLIRTGALKRMSIGGILGASSVHVGGAAEVDGILGQKDTWSARAGLRLGSSRRFTDQLSVRLDLSAGAVLRPIPIRMNEEELRIGGVFLGFSVMALVWPELSQAD